jgi:spore germination protein YaaH
VRLVDACDRGPSAGLQTGTDANGHGRSRYGPADSPAGTKVGSILGPGAGLLGDMRIANRRLRNSTPAILGLILVAAVLPAGGSARTQTQGSSGPVSPVSAATEIQPRITGIAPLSHEVYGYLPYWRLSAGTVDRIRYDLVSTIAFFGLGIKKSGAIDTDWVGYREYVGEDAAAVTNAAHAQGVRVVPTFQLFDSKSGAPKMSAFLGSATAQDRFINEALDLMANRQADGAGLDFEPNKAVNDRAEAYVAFVARFRAAMQARFPGSTLTTATSAGANKKVIGGLVPHVDQQLLMTYNYRWTGSTITGAIAPLDNTERTVKIHVARALQWAPASGLLLGVPYYGYDWPVKSKVPNAEVRRNKEKYGRVRSVTYASARDFLAQHPKVDRNYDAVEGSGYYTYWDKDRSTYRQVYFEEERSLAAKYDFAMASGLAGVGTWTLENDRGYDELYDVLHDKFYAPIHAVNLTSSIGYVRKVAGSVYVRVRLGGRNRGTVLERGSFRWTIRDAKGRLVRKGRWPPQTLLPGVRRTHRETVRLGYSNQLRAGTYTLRVRFVTASTTWREPALEFRQPY